MSESNPKRQRNTPSHLVGVPTSSNVRDSPSDAEILPDVAGCSAIQSDPGNISQSDPEFLPDVVSFSKTETLGTRHSSRKRQPPGALADYVTKSRSIAAKRKAERRAKQSRDEKQIRLGYQASYQARYRAVEITPERRAAHAAAEAQRRAQETPGELTIRLGKQAVLQSEYRAAETPEQLAIRLAKQAVLQSEYRAAETPEQLAIRLGKQAVFQSEYRVAETPEQKAAHAVAEAQRRVQETPEQRAAHAAAEAQRRAQETPEQLAIRLGRQAEYRVAETPEQRAAHAAAKAQRRAQESPQQTAQRRETDRVRHQTRSTTRQARANVDMEAFFAEHPEVPSRTRGDYARGEEIQYALARKEAARAARERRRQEQLQQPESIAEQIRVGGPLCDINAHLNYATGTGTNPLLHDDTAHIFDEVAQCTKPDLADQWAQAVKLEERLKERMFNTAPCACCGELKPISDMKLEISENHEPDILELLVSEITPEIRRPTRVTLSTGQREYAIHESYQGQPHVSVCHTCYACLTRDTPRTGILNDVLRLSYPDVLRVPQLRV